MHLSPADSLRLKYTAKNMGRGLTGKVWVMRTIVRELDLQQIVKSSFCQRIQLPHQVIVERTELRMFALDKVDDNPDFHIQFRDQRYR